MLQVLLQHPWEDYGLEKFADNRLLVLQIFCLPSYPIPPAGQSPLFRPQNQTKSRLIRRRCPPDTGRQRRRFVRLAAHVS